MLSEVLGRPLIPTMENWLIWSRFWQQIVCMTSTRCWVWTGKVDRDGYGNIRVRGADGGVAKAHRVMFTWLVGPIPRDMTLDHLCRNTGCVNPEHLEVVDRGENSRRARTKDRCIRGHQLTPENVVTLSRGGRRCRICRDSFYGEHRESVRSRQAKAYRAKVGREVLLPNRERTHCKWGHPFDEANTRITSAGVRQCRGCGNRRDRERYANDPSRNASVKLRAKVARNATQIA
jgi:hypothetical protein